MWPGSVDYFGTRGHKLPVNAAVRRKLGKAAGDAVTVRLVERLG